MKLPSPEEYLQIIEAKALGGLATLNHHLFLKKEDGTTYLYETSRNSIVFKTEYNGKFYAVRFFLNDDPDLFRRYIAIENFLRLHSFSWKVPFEFLDKEFYPALKMNWINSLSFSEYLNLIINNPSRIGKLQWQLVNLSRDLEENGAGHGNLNLKHIRFVKQEGDYVLKLIDYDSMFIPSLKEEDSFGVGTAGFQHPMRLASDFSETIDRFSFWVFLTALELFKTQPSLWTNAAENGYDKSRQLLFTYRDFAFPQQSRAFQIIKSHSNAALNFYADKLITFCNLKSLDDIEAPQIFNEKILAPAKKEKSVIEIRRTEAIKQTEKENKTTPPASSVPEQKTTLPKEPVAHKAAVAEKNKEVIHLKVQSEAKSKEKRSFVKKKTGRTVAIIAAAFLLLFTSVYFVSLHQSNNKGPKITTTAKPQIKTPVKQVIAVPKPLPPKETVFTKANATQFLFQLYQAYNKRDLQSILSNYADTVNAYYDAGVLTKNKLGDVIKDLFIQPVSYECRPDLKTLQLNVQGDSCKLMIAIQEMIKMDKNSGAQKYVSKIEYTVDRSFKIHAEDRVD